MQKLPNGFAWNFHGRLAMNERTNDQILVAIRIMDPDTDPYRDTGKTRLGGGMHYPSASSSFSVCLCHRLHRLVTTLSWGSNIKISTSFHSTYMLQKSSGLRKPLQIFEDHEDALTPISVKLFASTEVSTLSFSLFFWPLWLVIHLQ